MNIIMNEENMKYIKNNDNSKVLRTEILFAPLLIILPFIVGVLLVNDYYTRGIIGGDPQYFGELILGIVIIIANIIFDIPFINSLIAKKEKQK